MRSEVVTKTDSYTDPDYRVDVTSTVQMLYDERGNLFNVKTLDRKYSIQAKTATAEKKARDQIDHIEKILGDFHKIRAEDTNR